jgi:iron(III) transport system substrate-binding protein
MTHSGDWEYPLNSAVPPPPGVKPFDSLEPPKVTPADLGDGSAPLELMQEVGLL